MHSLMRGLGHQRFDVVGHDLGLMIGYAMAADDPAPICSLTMIDATLPGLSEGPTALPDDPEVVVRMWHMMFNRLDSVNEALVQGREEIYFADQFATKGATRDSLPAEAVALYVEMLRRPGALHACFQPYRALPTTMEQNRRRVAERLPMPVLAVGGAASYGDRITGVAQQVAENVTGVVIPDCGHYVPEEAPGPLLAALQHHLR